MEAFFKKTLPPNFALPFRMVNPSNVAPFAPKTTGPSFAPSMTDDHVVQFRAL